MTNIVYRQALQAGKHVFCEKPPAFNATGLREVSQVEQLSDRKLMYGFNHRHHGAAVKMHAFVKSNTFGRLLWMRGRHGKSVDEDYHKTWRADPRLAGGGILLDQGLHMLDLFLYMGGEFDVVHALVSNFYWNLPGIEDNVFAIFRNSKTGQCASLHSTMTQWRHLFSFEVFLERGYMVLNGLKTPSGSYGGRTARRRDEPRQRAPQPAGRKRDRFEFDVDESWEREMMLFCDIIDKDLPVLDGGSASALAEHATVDFTKQGEVRSVTFHYAALMTCFANDYGYDQWLAKAIKHYGDDGDAVVLISVSGTSPSVVNAARYARERGLAVVAFTGRKRDNPLAQLADIGFWVDSDAYNVVENIHSIWVTATVDFLVGKAVYETRVVEV